MPCYSPLAVQSKRRNEINALSALQAILPALTGCTYSLDGCPDDSNSSSPDVDFVLSASLGDCSRMAVEHTVVEAFRGQNTYVRKAYDVVAMIDERCRGLLPSDRSFAMGISPHIIEVLDLKKTEEFLKAILPWTIQTANELRRNEYRYCQYLEQEIILMCHRRDLKRGGTIGRIATNPQESRSLALASLELAVSHGLRKLSKYKSLEYDTVLILEDISGAMHPTLLAELSKRVGLGEAIGKDIDFIVEFAANEGRMIAGSVWKERQTIYRTIPGSRKFSRDADWPRQE